MADMEREYVCSEIEKSGKLVGPVNFKSVEALDSLFGSLLATSSNVILVKKGYVGTHAGGGWRGPGAASFIGAGTMAGA